MSKFKSDIWKYFVKTENGAQCPLCNKDVRVSGNTTNLHSHLSHNHPDIKTCNVKGKKMNLKKKVFKTNVLLIYFIVLLLVIKIVIIQECFSIGKGW